ncbi:MAG TPA: hypothetical protein VFS83_05785, partial [Ktedonobacterales bacterium]|nr:hypothetical protein [Ktedonobacterales bacterium]
CRLRPACSMKLQVALEREAIDAVMLRLGDGTGTASRYEPLNARSHAARMIQHSICRRRAHGERLRPNDLTRIEEAVASIAESEQSDILNALAACRSGCRLTRYRR